MNRKIDPKTGGTTSALLRVTECDILRTYAVERSTPRSSVTHYRTIRLTTPDKSCNYN